MNGRVVIFAVSEVAADLSPGGSRFCGLTDFSFYNYGYRTKTYIDRASQLCLHAVATAGGAFDPRGGLITASRFGCLDSAQTYHTQMRLLRNPWFASPAQFTHSLSNMSGALTAIELGLKGPTNHYVGGADAAIQALWQAARLVAEGDAPQMAVCAYDSLSEAHERMIDEAQENPEIRYTEGAAALRVGRAEAHTGAAWEILGFGFQAGRDARKTLASAMAEGLRDGGVSGKEVALYVSGSYLTDAYYRIERPAVVRLLGAQTAVVLPKRSLGEGFAASALRGLCHAANPESLRGIGAVHAPRPGELVLLAGIGALGSAVVLIRRGG